MTRLPILGLGVFASLLLALASPAAAQTTWAVASQPELLAALSGASSGDTIRLTANITLTADLPNIQTDLTIDGSGHTLSGNGQYRGLIIGDLSVVAAPLPVSVSILNLTLANTVASGGAGASSFDGGGGGGGGLGGAIFVADQATVALSGVSVTGAGAVGGSGGAASGVPGPGIGGSGTGQVGVGGFGGSAATSGGYGGGGGGTLIGNFAGGSAFAGGAGSMIGGGGGGAGLGGAIFVQTGGALTVTGPLSVNGNSVTGGAGGPGAGNGAAYGGGVFLGGFGTITFAPPSGASVSVGDTIADAEGASGIPGAGSWGLVKDGAGTLILSGANQYSGGTWVDVGTLSVTSDANLGTPGSSLGLSGTSTLAITGSNTFARDLILDGSPSLAVASGTSANWAGSIVDSEMPAALVVTGGGTLRLSNPQNLFSNGLTIAGNTTVEFASEGALGAPGQGVQLGNASSAGTLRLTAGTVNSGRNYTLGGTAGGTLDVTAGGLLSLGGQISGSGVLGKAGAGTLVLAGANVYTGGTQVAAGTLRAAAVDVFGSGRMLVQSGATLDLNSFNQTLGSLSGAGNITLGSATLTAGADNTSTVASGAISGTGGLAKIGTGSLTLTGANTYSGGTTVSGGALIGTSTSLQGDILNNATVEFDQGSSGTYAGSMTGGGALTKRGSGTLALTGANTYSGGTTIAGGVLIGTSASLQGDIRNNASLVFDQAASGTYAGVISGSGTFTKSGAGTLTLSRSSTFTGGASIAGGVLRAGTANVFGAATAVGVASGATFDLNNFSQTLKSVSGGGNIALGSATLTTGGSNASAVLSGVISGTGSLVKTGGGTLALTGANTYSGGTRVSGGILLGNSTSLQGGILDDARVVFDQAFDGTFSGSIAGSGILEKAGGGTLTLAGTDTHTGGTLISGGSLVVTAANLSGFVQNDGGLIFGGGADGVFSGTLGGTGSLNKRGTGTLTLNGYHIFSGLTTVAEGTLALNGVLDGNVTVAPGATFRANGTVFRNVDLSGRLSVQSGVVLPAGPATDVSLEASAGAALPPALTIGGNLVARPNSVLELSLAPGTDPLLLVGGVATLDGTRVDATLIDLGTQRNVSFLALSALKGLTVTDTTVAVQDPLLATMLTQRDTSLFVTVLNLGVPLASAVSPNLASVAGAVDTLKADMTGDRGFVVRELLALDDAELNGAMQAIAGELHASNRHVVIRSAESFTDLIRSEMTDRDHEAGAGQPGWGGRKVRWFGQLSRQHAAFDSRGGAAGGGFDVSDGVGGFEYKVSDRVLVGGGAGFGFGSMSLGGLSASSDLTTPRAFGIVGFKPLGFSLRAGGSFSRSKATSKRRIVIIATLPAEFGGGPLSAGIDREALSEEVTVQNDQWSEYADNFDIKTYTLDFMFGLRRARFSRDAFLETGAGALSLRSRGDTISLTDVDAKIHFRRREGNMRPYVEALVRHSSGFRYKLPVEFAADENSDFEAAGLPMGRNAFAGRAGVWFDRRIGTFILEYRIRVASGQAVQTGGLRFRF